MYAFINDNGMIEPKDGTLIQEFFGNTEIDIEDLINGFEEVLRQNKELERKLEEDYQPKEIDYYEEYGLSEDDFH